ncbi:hypothetical protein ACO0QE_000541 [Hanseniaspora vineae]
MTTPKTPTFDLELLKLLNQYDQLLDELQSSMKTGFTQVSRAKFFYATKGTSGYNSIGCSTVGDKFHEDLELYPLIEVNPDGMHLCMKNYQLEQDLDEKEGVNQNNDGEQAEKVSEDSTLRQRLKSKKTMKTGELSNEEQISKQEKLDEATEQLKKNTKTNENQKADTLKRNKAALKKKEQYLSKLKFDPIMVYNQGDIFGSSGSGNKLHTLKEAQTQFRESLDIMVKVQHIKTQIIEKLSDEQ